MPNNEQTNKKQVRQFHEQSLEATLAQQQREADRREEHRAEEHAEGEHAHQQVILETQQEERKKAGTKEWRRKEKLNKEAIESDKKRRADQTAALEERKTKDRDYEEKQHKFFESFRATAASKALAERKATERDIELKEEILRREKEAFAAKQKATADEAIAKNEIEHEYLAARDRIRRDTQAKRDALFGEEARAKTQCKDAQLREALRNIQKKRAEIDAEEQRQLRALQDETVRKKSAIEAKTRKTRADIDAEFYLQKTELNRKRKHLLEPDDEKKK